MNRCEYYPEIRFKGFTDAWEQRRLGDEIYDIIAGGDINDRLILSTGKYPVIANAITNDGIVGYYEQFYRVEAPAVTVTARGNIGHAKARHFNFTPVVRLISIRSKHDIHFLEESINKITVTQESTGVPQLTVPHFKNYVINFPISVLEEKHIGNIFASIDNLLTLHRCKLDVLRKTTEILKGKDYYRLTLLSENLVRLSDLYDKHLHSLRNIRKCFLDKMFPA